TIGADDGNLVAMAKAHLLQSYGKSADFVSLLCPCPALPDAVILVAHRWPIGKTPGVQQQIFRKRIERGRSVLQTCSSHQAFHRLSSNRSFLLPGRISALLGEFPSNNDVRQQDA